MENFVVPAAEAISRRSSQLERELAKGSEVQLWRWSPGSAGRRPTAVVELNSWHALSLVAGDAR